MRTHVLDDARPVRPAEQLDWPRVAAYLRERLAALSMPGLDLSCDMKVLQFAGGHSNLTDLASFGGGELVLRRAPLGPVAPTAHDMAREYRWLSALHPIFPLAPRPYLLCEDTAVLGAVFYAMERRHGFVVRADEPPPLAARPDLRHRVSAAMIDAPGRPARDRHRPSWAFRLGQGHPVPGAPGAWMDRPVAALQDDGDP